MKYIVWEEVLRLIPVEIEADSKKEALKKVKNKEGLRKLHEAEWEEMPEEFWNVLEIK